ncbi:MAG: type II toxin-antitoxin system HicB family antitoxin [Patescibacteria group bacterium]
MKKFNFKVIITQDEDSIFVASCPSIPGCHSQGNTYEEAQKNIEEVIKLCLKVAEEDKEYENTIDFGENEASRFIGITNVMANFSPSL